MMSLEEILLQPENEARLRKECVALISGEVARKRGLGGAAVKAGFTVARKVRPTIVEETLEKLLPEFVRALEDRYQQAGSDGAAFCASMQREPGAVAEALLMVTDDRIHNARPGIRKAYEKLRKGAKGHVEEAIPELARRLKGFF